MKGETTCERFGKKPRSRSRVPLLESPRKKLNIDMFNSEEELYPPSCLSNCADMLCPGGPRNQKQLLQEAQDNFNRQMSDV